MAPRTNTKPKRTGVLWALFRFDGRLSRQPYWLGLVLVWLGETLALSPYVNPALEALQAGDEAAMKNIMQSPVPVLTAVAVVWSYFALVAKRLHDRGLSGWFTAILPIMAMLAIFPLNLVLFLSLVLALGLVPSEKGPNRFGPGPNTRPL